MGNPSEVQLELASEGLLERLAAIEHERWAHWQSYLHGSCRPGADGSLVIPAELVSKWERQIDTRYEDLSEQEKQSDRDQVAKYLPVIQSALSAM